VARPVRSALPPCPTHDRTFDDIVGETLNKVSEQVNSFIGVAAGGIDEAKVRDSVARIVEDVTFLVDPEKAAAYGEKVRTVFAKRPRSEQRTTRGPAAGGSEAGGAAAGGSEAGDAWSDSTDDPPAP
jgi:hypothetical protein